MNEQQTGRTGSFMGGAVAQKPSFSSLQVGAGRQGFTPTSVLDEGQVLKSANGMSSADRARQPVKGSGRSVNGQSSTTFDKRMWIDSPYRTFG